MSADRAGHTRFKLRSISIIIGVGLFSCAIATSARADERRFTYVYEAVALPKGEWELENWFTWKTATEEDRQYDKYEFRHEIEYGLTDRLSLSLYVSDWEYEYARPLNEKNHRDRISEGKWSDVAVESIYNLLDPVKDPIGLSVYGEVKTGDELLELEGKILAQKNFGAWVVAYNASIEGAWEGEHLEEDNGELAQTAGISYQFSPKLLAGLELLNEFDMPDWQGVKGKGIFYLGPNVSYRAKKWWFTLTPLFQVSDVEDEPDFQMRLIVGIDLQ